MTPKQKTAIAVMFKLPVPGRVKTRLVPPLTEAQAAELHGCMVVDTFSRVSDVDGVELYAAVAGHGGDLPPGFIPAGVEVIPQRGGDLGERIINVFSDVFSRGHSQVIVIGSDSPDLPDGYVEEALSALGGPDTDMVLGPASDGGYVLVGMNEPRSEPFTGISWGTATVTNETLERAESAGISVGLMSEWRDIDTPEDLRLLEGNERAPRSAEYLSSLGKIPGRG